MQKRKKVRQRASSRNAEAPAARPARVMTQIYVGERLRAWPDAIELEAALQGIERRLLAGDRPDPHRVAAAKALEAVRRCLHEPLAQEANWERRRVSILTACATKMRTGAASACADPEDEELAAVAAANAESAHKTRAERAEDLRRAVNSRLRDEPGLAQRDRALDLARYYLRARLSLAGEEREGERIVDREDRSVIWRPRLSADDERRIRVCARAIRGAEDSAQDQRLSSAELAEEIVKACESALGDPRPSSLFDAERKKWERANKPRPKRARKRRADTP